MSNQAEIDYEKQFQEDLAKATALSLEQQALEEFKRCQKYGIAYTQSVQQEAKNRNYAQIRRQHFARRDSAETSISSSNSQYGVTLPPPKSSSNSSNQPQRRHSEVTHNMPPSTLLTEVERSKTPPAATPENDLINFASPTSKKPENSSFEQLIEDLQKLQATNPQTALVPLGPTAAAPMYPGYHHAATTATPAAAMYAGSAAAVQPPAQYGVTTAAGAAGMQLVPFTPPPQQQKVPLTHDELQKLYSLSQPPYTAPVYGARPMAYMPGVQTGAVYYPQTPPVMMGTAAAGVPYTAPVQYPNPFGFQYNMVTQPNQQQHYYHPTSSSSVSTTSLSSVAHNMTKPQQPASALNHSVNSVDSPSSSNSFQHTHSKPLNASTASLQSNGQNNFRRQTPPARKPKAAGSDLIDLLHEDE